MKFSRYLDETQIPEWKKAYIDFKGLKKRITVIRNARRGSSSVHLSDSTQASPQRPPSQPLVDDHTRQPGSYSSAVDHTPPRTQQRLATPTLNDLPRTEEPARQRPRSSLPQTSDVALSRIDSRDEQKVSRRPSFPKILATVTRRRPHRVPSQPNTIESLYISLDGLESSFFKYLDNELEKVDKFYNEHENEAVIKFSALKDQLLELQEHRRLFYAAKASARDEPWTMFPRALGEALGFSGGNHEETKKLSPEGDGTAAAAAQPPTPVGLLRDPAEYQHSKRKLKKAFQEYYRGLELLNDYRVLNLTGFRKALKKFEKVTRHPAQDVYMKEKIQPRRFAFSGTMQDLMREVESIFAVRFEHGDRKKARRRLKSPTVHKSHHFSTFRSGVYIGLAIPAFVSGIYSSFQPDTRQKIPEWGPLLEIYAVLFIPVIFSLLIGLNLLAWTRVRINFPFIFEFDVRTAIDTREYFELPTILFATLSYAFWLSFFSIGSHNVAPTTWPAIWIGLAIIILVNPFPILSKPARYWLLKTVAKFLVSGKYRVEFTDFWMGDQFCSLVFSLGHLFTIVCAYSNDWHNVFGKCATSTHWPVPFVLMSLPSLVRLVQSIRRYYDSRLPTHLINGGKYLSSIVGYAVYDVWRVRGAPYNYNFVIWCVFATLSSVYTSSWDLLMDWSFLGTRNHRFLRAELLYTNNPLIYYFAIISNIIIRFIWVIYIPAGGLNRRVRAFIAAILEMLRRFQWNFYRLENEQVGNTDQYRATREVPLPYSARELDEDDDEDSDLGEDESAPDGPTNVYNDHEPKVEHHNRQMVEVDEAAVSERR